MITSKITQTELRKQEKSFSRLVRGKNSCNIYIVDDNSSTGILIHRGSGPQTEHDYVGRVYKNLLSGNEYLYEPFYGTVEITNK